MPEPVSPPGLSGAVVRKKVAIGGVVKMPHCSKKVNRSVLTTILINLKWGLFQGKGVPHVHLYLQRSH